MKKLFAMIAIAATMVACNNESAETAEAEAKRVSDSTHVADSIASAAQATITNVADSANAKIDSTVKAVTDSIKK